MMMDEAELHGKCSVNGQPNEDDSGFKMDKAGVHEVTIEARPGCEKDRAGSGAQMNGSIEGTGV